MATVAMAWVVHAIRDAGSSDPYDALSVASRLTSARWPPSLFQALREMPVSDIGRMNRRTAQLFLSMCITADIPISKISAREWGVAALQSPSHTISIRLGALYALASTGHLRDLVSGDEGVRDALRVILEETMLMPFISYPFVFHEAFIPVAIPFFVDKIRTGHASDVLIAVRWLPSIDPVLVDAALSAWMESPNQTNLILVLKLAAMARRPLPDLMWSMVLALAEVEEFPVMIAENVVHYVMQCLPSRVLPPPEWFDIVFQTPVCFSIGRTVHEARYIMALAYRASVTPTYSTGHALLAVMAQLTPKETVAAIQRLALSPNVLFRVLCHLPRDVVACFAKELSGALFGTSVTLALDALFVLHQRPVPIPTSGADTKVFAQHVGNMIYGAPSRVLGTLHRCNPVFTMELLRLMCLPPVDVITIGFVGRVLFTILEQNSVVCPRLAKEVEQAMLVCLVRHWYYPGQQAMLQGGQRVIITKDRGDGLYDTNVKSGVFFLNLHPLRMRLRNLGDRKRFVLQSWAEIVRRGGRPPLELIPVLAHFVRHEEAFIVVRQDVLALYEAMCAKGLMSAAELMRLLRRDEVASIVVDMPRQSQGRDTFDEVVNMLLTPSDAHRILATRPHHHAVWEPWLLNLMVTSRQAILPSSVTSCVNRQRLWTNLGRTVKDLSDRNTLFTVTELINILTLVLMARDGTTVIPTAERPFFSELALIILKQPGSALGGKRLLVKFYRKFPYLLTETVMHQLLPYIIATPRVGLVELMTAVLSLPPSPGVHDVLRMSLSSRGTKRTRSDVSNLRADVADHLSRDIGRELADMLGFNPANCDATRRCR
jgi:hypothetical protein